MKNTGRIITALFVLLVARAAFSADITVSAGRNVIGAGERTTLEITVQGGRVGFNRNDVPVVQGLDISYGGTMSSYQNINGVKSSSTTITLNVYGEKEGSFMIPSIKVTAAGRELYTQPVTITVKKGLPGVSGNSSINVFCDVELSLESCYSGQPVMLRYFIYHPAGSSISVEEIVEQPVTNGFIVKQVKENLGTTDSVKKGLNLVKEHVATYCLIPEITGSRATGGGSMIVSARDTRNFFSRPVQGKLLFPEKKIKVIPVPAKGKPGEYSGDVGDFKLEAEVKSGQYKVNDEIRVQVTVTGRGNFFVISKPVFENTEGLKVLVEESDPELALDGNDIAGTKKFLVTIIPQAEGNFRPGVLALKYFNPVTGSYATASSEPLSLEVRGMAAPAEEKIVKQDEAGKNLPVLAYVGAGVLIASAAFGLAYIVIRERRRYAGLKAEANRKTETVKEIKTDPFKMLRDELEEAHATADREGLLKFCFRAADMLNDTPDGKSSAELGAAKAKLYAARFANASLSDGELEDVYGIVNGLLKKMK